ncbi:hypothetical protein H5410_030850, partial [Solanum commersonii]
EKIKLAVKKSSWRITQQFRKAVLCCPMIQNTTMLKANARQHGLDQRADRRLARERGRKTKTTKLMADGTSGCPRGTHLIRDKLLEREFTLTIV